MRLNSDVIRTLREIGAELAKAEAEAEANREPERGRCPGCGGVSFNARRSGPDLLFVGFCDRCLPATRVKRSRL